MRIKSTDNSIDIKRLLIIGNGFDIAHDLKTKYQDFDDYCTEVMPGRLSLLQFKTILGNITEQSMENWFELEKNFQHITYNIIKGISGTGSPYLYDLADSRMNSSNRVFLDILLLFKEYIKNEYERQAGSIRKIPAVERLFDTQTYAVSFNYTDTVKLYCDDYDYIHGNLNDDDYIVLGSSLYTPGGKGPGIRSEIHDLFFPETVCGDYLLFTKEEQEEKLNFIRYLKRMDSLDEKTRKKLADDFNDHLDPLFSGMEGYDFSKAGHLKGRRTDDTDMIYEYARSNGFSASGYDYPFSDVEEVMILGHSMETDDGFFDYISEKARHIRKIGLFTFPGEPDDEIMRKKDLIMHFFGGHIGYPEEIMIETY